MKTYIYVIGAVNEAMKIGIAKNVSKRLESLQTGNHRELSILYTYPIASPQLAERVEKDIHKYLHFIHIRGEWFKYKPGKANKIIEKIISTLK